MAENNYKVFTCDRSQFDGLNTIDCIEIEPMEGGLLKCIQSSAYNEETNQFCDVGIIVPTANIRHINFIEYIDAEDPDEEEEEEEVDDGEVDMSME